MDMHNLSESVKGLWNVWEIRSMMLLSLSLQIFLFILGNRRKYTAGFWLGIVVWLAYLSADWVATVSLGILARSQGDSETTSTKPNLIPLFWAPILLVHLGGPATITAYSLEDNELWLRRLLELLTQVSVAIFVLFRLWRTNSPTFVAIPIFISGIIKYAERIWAFRSAISDTIHMYDHPYFDLRSAISKTIVMDVHPAWISSYPSISPKEDVRCLHDAHLLFKTSWMLFKDFDLIDLDQDFTKRLVSEKKAEDAFKLIEVELGFMYDQLYSKVTHVSFLRIILHSISFLSSISALVSFSIMTLTKNVYSKDDTAISYLLLVGAVFLEIYSIIVLLLSDSTLLWLGRSKKAEHILERIKCFSPLLSFCRKRRRWSRSMAQHNLISAQSNKTVKKLLKKYFPGKWNIHGREDVDKDLKELIFKQVLDKSPRYNARNFIDLTKLLEDRGHGVLQSYHCFEELGWSVADVEFSHSLLAWHIAIHFCYYDDYFGKNDAPDDPNCKMSRLLSSYMLYLLVERPTMLPGVHIKTRYTKTSIHLFIFLFLHTHEGRELDKTPHKEWKSQLAKGSFQEAEVDAFFKKLLQSPSAMLNEIKKEDEGEKSALLDGCMLAMSLQSLETKELLPDGQKWKMISEVCVDMLMYAASHCGWKEHARALTRGGELLTHVCLLMAHIGLSKRCRPQVGEQLSARTRRFNHIVDPESQDIVCLLMAHLGLSKQCRPQVSEQLAARTRRFNDIVDSESQVYSLLF